MSQNITVTLTGGALTITDVADGNDTLSLSQSAGDLVIAADVASVIGSNAGTGSGTNSVSIPLIDITGVVTVNAAGGTDIINVGAIVTPLSGLTVNGGTGNDTVNLNGDITFAGNANLDVDLQNDPSVASGPNLILNGDFELGLTSPGSPNDYYRSPTGTYGAWSVTAANADLVYINPYSNPSSIPSNGSNEALHIGPAYAKGAVSQTFATTVGATYEVSLAVVGNSGGSGTAQVTANGSFVGNYSAPSGGTWVSSSHTFVATSASTTLQIQEVSGGSTIDDVVVRLVSVGTDTVNFGTNANLILSGAGTATLKMSGPLLMTNSGASLVTQDGDITIETNQQTPQTSGTFYGVSASNVLIEATGTGNIVIKGRAAVGGASTPGVAIDPGAVVRSNTGAITIVGTGGTNSGGQNNGAQVHNGSIVESTGGGAIDITGIAGSQGMGIRVLFNAKVRNTGTGTITLTGVGGATTGPINYGVGIDLNTGGVSPSVTCAGSGTITINGTPGAATSGGISAPGFYTANGGAGTIRIGFDGTNAYSGDIIINADSMNIANAAIQTTGTATLRQKTNGTLINLGAADSAGLLGLTDAELDQVTAGTLAIGDANSGAITISALISPANYKTLDIQNGVSFAATGGFASDVTSATVYEKIKANGAVSISTSASLTVTAFGGFVPAASDTFTILDNVSASTTTGNFSGKPGGALIAIGGVNKVLGYAGGTGNDVVLNAASSNADLANLTTTAGALTFDSAVTSYTAGVPNTISSITMTPTAAQGNATIKVNGVTVTSGSPSAAISLNPGANTVTVLVTAQDGVTTKTYTLTVDRLGVVATGAPSAGRSEGVSILLNDGRVLVAGGSNLASAELYDPITGNWTATGSMSVPRSLPTGVLLPSGKVLVAGGFAAGGNAYASAELYDPSTGLWSATGSMNFARTAHTSTLLPDGTVLVAGGATVSNSTTQATVEIYDPGTGAWTAVASMATARDYHTATLLPNGTVLVAAGTTFGLGGGLTSCEIYDPVANTWTPTGSITGPRYAHTATLLRNGKVLLAGGFNAGFVTGAQLYDPVAGTWSSTTGNMIETRAQFHSASLLPNGKVLIAGGQGNTGDLRSLELYDPGTGLFTAAGNLSVPRKTTNATVLANGKVLITGHGAAVADLYDPVTVSPWVSTGSLGTGRTGHSTTLLADGKVLVTGGHPNNQATPTAAAEVYDPALGTWAATGALNTARYYHKAILLPTGKVLVAGGDTTHNQGTPINSAELYDPVAGTWSVTGTMNNAGEGSLVLLANGQVLFHSLSNGGSEQYDPATGLWTAKGVVPVGARGIAVTLPDGRVLSVGASKAALYDPTTGLWALAVTPNNPNNRGEGGSLTLLPNGKVLLAGGFGNNTCELYDPAAGTWAVTGALTGRNQYAAGVVLLPNGKVLHAGGIRYNGGSSYELVATSSLYDPISGVWTQGPSMPLARTYVHPGVALLPNGKVLFPGGSGINVTATLFDPDAGIAPSWRPQIATTSVPLAVGVPLTLTGTGFRGISGASSSGAMDSASNYPVVQLRSLHHERSIFLAADTMANWSDTTFTSTALPSFPAGYAMATVFTNGIPSVAAIVRVIGPPSVLGITPASGPTAGGTPVTITGSNFTGATSVTIGGVAVTGFTVVDDTHITTTLPTGIVGLADVVVVGVGGTGTATGVFTFVDSLIVTTTSDVIDNADNVVSLREALAHAATLVGQQTITFGDGSADGGTDFTDATPDTITLTSIGDGTAGPSAFGITSAVTIQGNATTAIILAGGGGASNLRAFYIASSGSLTLRSLTLSGFRHKGGDGAYSGGGAAGLGGAIFNNGGALVIFASTFSGNVAEGGAGSAFSMVGYANFGTGGGLGGTGVGDDGGGPNGGTMGISSNGGFGGGGARWSSDAVNPWPGYSGAGGFGGGGGNGPLQAMSGFGGGSLYSDPTYGIKSGSAGGFGGGAGGLYVDWSGESSSGYGGGGMGGAVFNNGGTTTVTNSTFASNGAYGGFGFNYLGYGSGYGGALFSRNGTVSLLNCTISANTANQGGRGVYVLADTSDGGNNTSPGSGTVVATINNTIIGSGDIIVPDFVAGTNPLSPGGTVTTSGTGNFIRTATGFSGTVISTADPLLAPLADNGGATQTMALLPGSPAIDAGDAAAASSLTTDQRGAGFDRSVVSVDSGSFESRGFSMIVDGGDNQQAPVGTLFASPLSIAISSSFGEPVDGGRVTFTAPAAGASATLTTSPAIIAAGVASVTAQANAIAGDYNVTASATGAGTSPILALTNTTPEIAINGNGINIPGDSSNVPAAADNTDFGGSAVTVEHAFTIANSGNGDLILSGTPVVLSNTVDFSVSVDPNSPVAALTGSTAFRIAFTPLTPGVKTSTVTIVSNDADEGTFVFNIQGTGVFIQVPVVTTAGAPDAAGTASIGQFDLIKRGGFLGDNGHLVFPGELIIGLGGVTASPNNFMGIWKDDGSGLKLLARSGDPAPEAGGALFDILPTVPAINDSGEVTLLASLALGAGTPTTTTANDTGLWSELGGTGLQILIREDDDIPGLPVGTKVGRFVSGAFATAKTGPTTGEAAFALTMKGASTDSAVLRTSIIGTDTTAVGVVAREGAAAPGTGQNFANLAGPYTDSMRMDATGNLVFAALLAAPTKESLWYQPIGGATTKVFAVGDVAPNTGAATFRNLKSPAIGSAGVITFRGLLNRDGDNAANTKNDGIWRGTVAGGFSSILRRGDAGLAGMPGGSLVGNVWHGWLNNANHGAWRAWLDVNGNTISSASDNDVHAIFTDINGGVMEMAVKVGDAAPGIVGATFASMDLPIVGSVTDTPSANEWVVFIGKVTGGGTIPGVDDQGIWRKTGAGAFQLVIRAGDTITTTEGMKTIQKLDFPGSGSTDRRWEQPVMDNTGRLLIYVKFTDGSTSQVLAP